MATMAGGDAEPASIGQPIVWRQDGRPVRAVARSLCQGVHVTLVLERLTRWRRHGELVPRARSVSAVRRPLVDPQWPIWSYFGLGPCEGEGGG